MAVQLHKRTQLTEEQQAKLLLEKPSLNSYGNDQTYQRYLSNKLFGGKREIQQYKVQQKLKRIYDINSIKSQILLDSQVQSKEYTLSDSNQQNRYLL